MRPLRWTSKIPLNNFTKNLEMEGDNNIEMLWDTQFHPLFPDLLNDDSWWLLEEEMAFSEYCKETNIRRKEVPKEIIIIKSDNKGNKSKKKEIIIIDSSDDEDKL